MTTDEYELRIKDLLDANHRYLERAEKAEDELRLLQEKMKPDSQNEGSTNDSTEIMAKDPGVFNFQ